MRILHLKSLLIFVLLLSISFVIYACSETDEDDEEDDNSAIYNIQVFNDDIYNFSYEEVIGEVYFENTDGLVGTRVDTIVKIDELSKFTDREVKVKIYLENQDATREGFTPLEWTQAANESNQFFIIPVVETVPATLNFRVLLYEDSEGSTTQSTKADDDDDDDDNDTAADDDDDNNDDDNDSTTDDDDDDTTNGEPDHDFMAWAEFIFIVTNGAPGTGD